MRSTLQSVDTLTDFYPRCGVHEPTKRVARLGLSKSETYQLLCGNAKRFLHLLETS